MKPLKYIGLIPARYASTRFPGKPLALLGGKPVIQHVYEKASGVLQEVYVCTDDERILEAVRQFGGKAVLTASSHRSGTDRCREAYLNIGSTADVVVNIQGDEPFVHPGQIKALQSCFADPSTDIATLVKPFQADDSVEMLESPNTPKVVLSADGRALYFSRSVVPYLRGVDRQEWLRCHTFYKHIGLYAYRADVLDRITRLNPGRLEKAESLEQLRWLENGFSIRVAMTDVETVGIDTPEDLTRAEAFLASRMQKGGDR